MKNSKKTVIIILFILAILIIGVIFFIATRDMEISDVDEKSVLGVEIIEPDRMVYRNGDGKYFEFVKDSEEYNQLKNILSTCIKSFSKEGEKLSNDQIDEIHEKSFIEFDYEKVSKNYIIQLDNNDKKAVIKLADEGGYVCTQKISNLKKLKKVLKTVSKNAKEYNLEYKELISKNTFNGLEYKYKQLFNEVNFKIHQVKIDNMRDYEVFEAICKLSFDEPITEELLENNDLILTVTSIPKINVKVNIGNIKYTYENVENAIYQYTVHGLIVSKIVNTDCIYNKDMTEIQNQVAYDNMKVEYDDSVAKLDEELFMVNYENFIEKYNKTDSYITKQEAEVIVEKGFLEAERICGAYDKITQTCSEQTVKPNNFFTRKMTEGDKIYNQSIEVYVFRRVDDMDLNGVEIYVDKKLGRIIGGGAFGD